MLPVVNLEIPLVGEDRKTDAVHVAPGKVTRAENVRFHRPGAYNKRNGYTRLTNNLIGGGTHGKPIRCTSHRGDSLIADEQSVYQYVATALRWQRKGPSPRFHVTRLARQRPTVRTSASYYTPSGVAYAAGIICICYVYDNGSVLNGAYILMNAATGEIISRADVPSLAPNTAPKAVGSFDGSTRVIRVFYTLSTSPARLDYDEIDLTDHSVSTTTGLATNAQAWDVAPVEGSSAADWLVAFRNTSGNTITIARYNIAGVVQAIGTSAESNTVSNLCVYGVDGEDAYVAYAETVTPTAKAVSWPMSSFSSLNSGYPASFHSSVTPRRLGMARVDANSVALVYDYDNSGVDTLAVDKLTDTGWGGVRAEHPELRNNVRPLHHDGRVVALVHYDSNSENADPTSYLIEVTDSAGALREDPIPSAWEGLLLGTIAPGLSEGSPDVGWAPPPLVQVEAAGVQSDIWYGALFIQSSLDVLDDGEIAVERAGVDWLTIDARNSSTIDQRCLSVEWGGARYFAGAQIMVYDGEQMVDAGHTMSPAKPTSPGFSTGTLNGAYQYVTVFEWQDATGAVHRSAPSPVSATINPSTQAVDLDLDTPWIRGHKFTATQNVQLALYRTKAGGGDFFFHSYRDPTTLGVASPDISDNTADASLEEPLYTTGGVVANTAMPACKVLVRHQDRMFAAGLDANPESIAYTKPYLQGVAPEFALQTFEVRIPGSEEITALASFDTVLVAFSKNQRIYAIIGDGPVSTGVGQDYRVQEVPSDVGCTNPRSVTVTPLGAIFESEKGPMLIDRGLQVRHFQGIPERALSNGHTTVVGAVQRRDNFEIMLPMDGVDAAGERISHGRAMVFDYVADQWAEDVYNVAGSLSGVRSMAEAGGLLFWAGDDGRVYQETSAFVDNESDVLIAFEFSLSIGGLGGWERVRFVTLVGEWIATHSLEAKFAYSDYTDEVTWDDTVPVSTTVVGQGYPLRIRLPRQRMGTLRCRIAETPSEAPATESARWIACVLEGGAKRGAFKVPANRQV